MKIVVGLGNPGAQYARTRHNIGWRVLDALAVQTGKDFRPGKGEYYVLETSFDGEPAALIKPTTFMNGSGLAVAQAIERYEADIANDLLIVIDEFQMSLGLIRLTTSGGDGGHNGMASVIGTLLTDKFARLRCGIDRKFNQGAMADYVLSPFMLEEEPAVDVMVQKARDAARAMITLGTVRAMNLFNAKPETRAPEAVAAPDAQQV